MTIKELKTILNACRQPLLIGPLAKKLPTSDHDLTIFVDGGCKLRPANHKASVAVGDGDSKQADQSLDFTIPKDKDYSDLAFVLRHLPEKINSVRLVGFVGGRIDHQLAVLGGVYYFLKTVEADRVLFDDHQLIFLDSGQHAISIHGQFSLMAFEPCEVLLTGKAKYQVSPKSIMQPLSSFGLSNHGSGEVMIENSEPLLLIQGNASQDRLAL